MVKKTNYFCGMVYKYHSAPTSCLITFMHETTYSMVVRKFPIIVICQIKAFGNPMYFPNSHDRVRLVWYVKTRFYSLIVPVHKQRPHSEVKLELVPWEKKVEGSQATYPLASAMSTLSGMEYLPHHRQNATSHLRILPPHWSIHA